MWTNPSVADFQTYFFRDFPYGTDPTVSILDQDITSAFMSTNFNINQGLFCSQSDYTLGYLYLSAHYMVMNLRASTQGMNGQYNFLQVSKGAGSINESFSIPQMILDNPLWSMYTKTNYGMYYIQLLYPQLAGQMWVAYGTTLP